MSDTVKNSGG
ncbi:uncharacterized protein FFNC_15678 [Fusarium fujikuroi]|nr:uncharacterized protein FFNC_15678 [Fusarium fujikuroi]